MNRSISRLGFGAALISLLCVAVYIVCFLGIYAAAPLFVWTDLSGFIAYNLQYDQTYKYLAMLFMLLYGICHVICMTCLEQRAEDPGRKTAARLASLFGLGFAILTGINYFIQITAVRLQVGKGVRQGLEQLIMSYPISGVAAVNMLGWTVFLGFSALFAAFCYPRVRGGRLCRYSFLALAGLMLAAAVGYAADSRTLLFICMYPGLGGAMTVTSIGLCLTFRRDGKEEKTHEDPLFT